MGKSGKGLLIGGWKNRLCFSFCSTYKKHKQKKRPVEMASFFI
jgi:hypothetical protein